MKKILALALALLLVMGMTGALAVTSTNTKMEDVPTDKLLDASATTNTVTITKQYALAGTNASNPSDTLKFTVTGQAVTEATQGTTCPDITIEDVTVAEGAASASVIVKLPRYERVGVYTYTIREQDTNVAGVTYYDKDITLVVTVVGVGSGESYALKAVPAVHCETTGDKTDSFTNKYDAGSLSVKKIVTGNLGDHEKVFNFTVTFTATAGDKVNAPITWTDDGTAKTVAPGDWTKAEGAESYTATADITLKHDETIQFDNIPAGTQYSIVETEANQDGYTTTSTRESGAIATAATAAAEFTNHKERNVDTGVTLDSLPYILLLAAVAAGAALLMARRRRSRED